MITKVNQSIGIGAKQSGCQQLKKDCTFDVKPRRDGRTARLLSGVRKMRGRMGEEETKRRRDGRTARLQDCRTAGQHGKTKNDNTKSHGTERFSA